MEPVRPRGTDKAEVMQVIKTTSLLGLGTKEDPVRYIYQYWDFEGKLLARHDTLEYNKVFDCINELPTHKFSNKPPELDNF